jgi:hypothetical protein
MPPSTSSKCTISALHFEFIILIVWFTSVFGQMDNIKIILGASAVPIQRGDQIGPDRST